MSPRRAASMDGPRCQIDPICAFHLISVVRLVAVQNGGSGVKDAETLITERDLLGEVAGRLAVGSQNNRVPANFAGWQVRPGACCGQVTDTRLPASGGRVAAGEPFRTPGGREAR